MENEQNLEGVMLEEEMESFSSHDPNECTAMNPPFCQQITLQQYKTEGIEYTSKFLRELEQSEDYRIHVERMKQAVHEEQTECTSEEMESVSSVPIIETSMESFFPSDPNTVESTVTRKTPYCQQITLEEYKKEGIEYTRNAVRVLQLSEDYKIHSQKCHSCGASWYSGQWSESCAECDGHAFYRCCPICKGLCQQVWKRDVSMSHYNHRGFWDGECGLGEEEKRIHYYRTFVDLSDEAALCDAIDDVSIK